MYGREHIEHRLRFRQQKYDRTRLENEPDITPATHGAPLGNFGKVFSALKGMGFRDAQARFAIAEVERHGQALTVGEVLREAVLVATAKCA